LHIFTFAVFASAGAIIDFPEIRLFLLAFFEPIRCPLHECLYFTLPEAVTFTLLVKPLWVFCLGIYLVPEKIFTSLEIRKEDSLRYSWYLVNSLADKLTKKLVGTDNFLLDILFLAKKQGQLA